MGVSGNRASGLRLLVTLGVVVSACGETERSRSDGAGATTSVANTSTGLGGGGLATVSGEASSSLSTSAGGATGGGGTSPSPGSGGSTLATSRGGAAGTPNAGGAAGSAGVGAAAPGDGLSCYNIECEAGALCANCDHLGAAIEPLCVPHPDRDPAGFRAATEGCPLVDLWAECDGREDCAPAEFCSVVRIQPAEPEHRFLLGSCGAEALDCNGGEGCTLCNEGADCPTGWKCTESLSIWGSGDTKGCVAE